MGLLQLRAKLDGLLAARKAGLTHIIADAELQDLIRRFGTKVHAVHAWCE